MKQPFSHENLQLKQYFVNLARELRAKPEVEDDYNQNVANELAVALLYMNVADYLAEYLVTSLNSMAKEAVDKYYLGVMSVRPPKRDGFNIGESIKFLQRFDFPKKSEIIQELDEVNKARKQIAHQILKTNGEELENIDNAVRALADHTEELVSLVDSISNGLPPRTLVEKLASE